MSTKTTNTDIRQLSATELDEVTGGLLDPLSALIGAAIALGAVAGIVAADDAGAFDSIPVGKIISGKGRPA